MGTTTREAKKMGHGGWTRGSAGAGIAAVLLQMFASSAAHAQPTPAPPPPAQGPTTTTSTTETSATTTPTATGVKTTATQTTTTTTVVQPQTTTPVATEAHEEGETVPASEKEREEEARFVLGVDMVLGFGKSHVVTDKGAGANMSLFVPSRAQTTTESFVFAAGYEISEHIEVGMRLPMTHGEIFAADSSSRNAFALGNLELEGAYRFALGENLSLFAELGLALPTAQGHESPDDVDKINPTTFSTSNSDRSSINSFAGASRGWEENALFETEHLGIVPKLELKYEKGRLEFEPYAKYENLIATTSSLEKSYLGELVIGGRVGYRLNRRVTVGLRAWTNIPLANNPGVETVGVAEPEVRMFLGPVEPFAGVILPFAGPLDDPYTVGVRIGIAGRL